jgi:hypothetical protein
VRTRGRELGLDLREVARVGMPLLGKGAQERIESLAESQRPPPDATSRGRVGTAPQLPGLGGVGGAGVARPAEQLVVVAEVVPPLGSVAGIDAVDEVEAEGSPD